MGGTVVFKGQAELSAALMRKAGLDAVKTVVRANGTRLQQWTKLRAPIDTGTLFRSIDLQIKDGGLSLIRVTDNGCGIDKSQIKRRRTVCCGAATHRICCIR